MAEALDHPAVNRFVKQLRYFEYGILNRADYPIGTSKLEGINNKIKVIKRKAYGFHDERYFILKVKTGMRCLNLTNFFGVEPKYVILL